MATPYGSGREVAVRGKIQERTKPPLVPHSQHLRKRSRGGKPIGKTDRQPIDTDRRCRSMGHPSRAYRSTNTPLLIGGVVYRLHDHIWNPTGPLEPNWPKGSRAAEALLLPLLISLWMADRRCRAGPPRDGRKQQQQRTSGVRRSNRFDLGRKFSKASKFRY